MRCPAIVRIIGNSAVILGALAATRASANEKTYLSLALTQTEDTSQAQNARGKDLVTIINASAAYVMAPGIGLGAKYFDYNQNGRSTEETGTVISGWGPMVGYYHQSGFFGHAAYLLSPTKVYEDDSGKATFKDGTGYVIDIGKVFEFNGWGAGLQISYSKVDYETFKQSGSPKVNLTGTWYDTSLYPYINFFIYL